MGSRLVGQGETVPGAGLLPNPANSQRTTAASLVKPTGEGRIDLRIIIGRMKITFVPVVLIAIGTIAIEGLLTPHEYSMPYDGINVHVPHPEFEIRTGTALSWVVSGTTSSGRATERGVRTL